MSNYKIVHLYVQCHFTPSPLGRRSRAESRPKADISASSNKRVKAEIKGLFKVLMYYDVKAIEQT